MSHNITIAGLGEILAEEIMKSLRKRFETDDDRQIVGELYYEYIIRELESEKEEAVANANDEIAALRFEKRELENKATARALLDGEHIAQLEKSIREFNECNAKLIRERDEYRADYIRVCKKYSETCNIRYDKSLF